MNKVSRLFCRSNRFSLGGLLVGVVLLSLFLRPSLAQAGKVRILNSGPQAGHYLEWNGTPILLIGDSVTQGWMEGGTNFDQEAYVDALASRGINVLMIWSYMGTSASIQQSDVRIAYDAPESWPWVGSPDRKDFDLTQLNQAYFDRLKDMVAYCESKGIVVLICIHDGWTKSRFDGHPFNSALGNGPLTERQQYVEFAHYGSEMPETYNSSWSQEEKNQYFQERLCAKLISELSPYSNVIYEMMNEGDWYDKWYNRSLRDSYEQHFLSFFRSRCDNLLLTNSDHVPGDDPHNDSKVDVITLHGDWTERFSDFQSGFHTSPAKPYLMSEPVPGWDGTNHTLDTIRQSMWEVTMAGSGWVNQNDPSFGWDRNAAIAAQASLRDAAYDYAGHCARFFNESGVDFSNMRPDGSLSSTGICLAQQGIEYGVYAPSGGSFSVNLSGASEASTFAVEWYNPRSGEFGSGGTVQGGTSQTFYAPDSNDWVLHLVNTTWDLTGGNSTEGILVDEPLTIRPASGTVHGGDFTAEGWKATSNGDYIEYRFSTITNGWVEFDVKGWHKSPSVFNDGLKYHFSGMWDGSWTGASGNDQIRYNPYKALTRVYGFNEGSDEYYGLLKLRLNVQAFEDGGEHDPNAFECFANPDSYPSGTCTDQGVRYLWTWDPDRTYHFRLEWGDGAMRWYLDGDEVTYYDYSSIGLNAYDPPEHVFRIGRCFIPCPWGRSFRT